MEEDKRWEIIGKQFENNQNTKSLETIRIRIRNLKKQVQGVKKRENLLKRKMKDEPKYENDLINQRFSNENIAEERKGSGKT